MFNFEILHIYAELIVVQPSNYTNQYQTPEFLGKTTMMIYQTVNVDLWCDMDFYEYPLDHQVKHFFLILVRFSSLQ